MTKKDQKKDVFAAAVEEAGGQAAVSKQSKIMSQQNISYLIKNKKKCPAELVPHLERMTNGKFPRHVIRPDLYDVPQDHPQ